MLFFFYRYVPTQHTDLYIEQACADPEKLSGEYFFSTGGGGGCPRPNFGNFIISIKEELKFYDISIL